MMRDLNGDVIMSPADLVKRPAILTCKCGAYKKRSHSLCEACKRDHGQSMAEDRNKRLKELSVIAKRHNMKFIDFADIMIEKLNNGEWKI